MVFGKTMHIFVSHQKGTTKPPKGDLFAYNYNSRFAPSKRN